MMFLITTIIISLIAMLLLRYCVKNDPIVFNRYGDVKNEEWEAGLTAGFVFGFIPISNVIVVIIFGAYAIGYTSWYKRLMKTTKSNHWLEKFLFIKKEK